MFGPFARPLNRRLAKCVLEFKICAVANEQFQRRFVGEHACCENGRALQLVALVGVGAAVEQGFDQVWAASLDGDDEQWSLTPRRMSAVVGVGSGHQKSLDFVEQTSRFSAGQLGAGRG